MRRDEICKLAGRRVGSGWEIPQERGKCGLCGLVEGLSLPGQQCILREFFLGLSEAVPNLSLAMPLSLVLTPLGRRKVLAHCFCLPHPGASGQGPSPPLRFASFLFLPFSMHLGWCVLLLSLRITQQDAK